MAAISVTSVGLTHYEVASQGIQGVMSVAVSNTTAITGTSAGNTALLVVVRTYCPDTLGNMPNIYSAVTNHSGVTLQRVGTGNFYNSGSTSYGMAVFQTTAPLPQDFNANTLFVNAKVNPSGNYPYIFSATMLYVKNVYSPQPVELYNNLTYTSGSSVSTAFTGALNSSAANRLLFVSQSRTSSQMAGSTAAYNGGGTYNQGGLSIAYNYPGDIGGKYAWHSEHMSTNNFANPRMCYSVPTDYGQAIAMILRASDVGFAALGYSGTSSNSAAVTVSGSSNLSYVPKGSIVQVEVHTANASFAPTLVSSIAASFEAGMVFTRQTYVAGSGPSGSNDYLEVWTSTPALADYSSGTITVTRPAGSGTTYQVTTVTVAGGTAGARIIRQSRSSSSAGAAPPITLPFTDTSTVNAENAVYVSLGNTYASSPTIAGASFIKPAAWEAISSGLNYTSNNYCNSYYSPSFVPSVTTNGGATTGYGLAIALLEYRAMANYAYPTSSEIVDLKEYSDTLASPQIPQSVAGELSGNDPVVTWTP